MVVFHHGKPNDLVVAARIFQNAQVKVSFYIFFLIIYSAM